VKYNSKQITLLLLTLNEIEGMKAILPQIDRRFVDQIIVVDGGSTDGTIEWSREQGLQVYVQVKNGFRYAYKEVWEHVQGDVVITFSPDGNSVAQDIPRLIEKFSEGYDLVIASRYLPGAGSDDDDRITAFGNWLFTRTVNLLHGGSYTDAMVIFRIFKKELPLELDLFSDAGYSRAEKLFSTRISWEPLMSVRAARANLKITEIASKEPPRIGGERKLQIWKWGAAYYFQFFRELF
jgi:glycosyltransferase involved in cell wall biosynthesis